VTGSYIENLIPDRYAPSRFGLSVPENAERKVLYRKIGFWIICSPDPAPARRIMRVIQLRHVLFM
jgi:hypothetical protein